MKNKNNNETDDSRRLKTCKKVDKLLLEESREATYYSQNMNLDLLDFLYVIYFNMFL